MPRQRNPKRDLAYQLWLNSGKKKKIKDIASELNLSKSQIYRWKSQDHWEIPTNKNPGKYGFFRKYLPEETVSIIEEMPDSSLDILWGQIQIFYASIIRAQRNLYGQEHKSEDTAMCEGPPTAAEAKQASEKHSNFLQAQTKAQKTLEGLISRYEELLHKNWALATEEQKERVQKMKAETKKLSKESGPSPEGDHSNVTVQFYMPNNNRTVKAKEQDKDGD